MNTSHNIIKEIEKYYLDISQKGIMLSSQDYHLITEWIEKGISKEQILKGIRTAFENKNTKKIRNLSDCSQYVEIFLRNKESDIKTIKSDNLKTNPNNSSYLLQILNKFNNLMENNSKPELNDYFIKINDKLKYFINSKDDEIFSNINKLEEEFFQKLPEHMNSEDKTIFKTELNTFINSKNDYINEKSKNRALNNYSKNFIITNYLGINPFEI